MERKEIVNNQSCFCGGVSDSLWTPLIIPLHYSGEKDILILKKCDVKN